jgi:serine/threonine protein kinase/predicted ATPase
MKAMDGAACPSCGKRCSEFDVRCGGCGERRPAVQAAPELARTSGPEAGGPRSPAAAGAQGLLGQRVSRYRVVERLGRGGMGTVYRVQEAVSGRWLALKVVHGESEELSPRLRREIHALGRLAHPGIVKIVEAGQHEGRPWYAMELLEGPTLAAWANGQWRVSGGEWRVANGGGCVGTSLALPEPRAATGSSTAGASEEPRWWTESLSSAGAEEAAAYAAQTAWDGQLAEREIGGAGQALAAGGRLSEVLTLLRRLAGALAYLHGEGLVHRDLKPQNVLLRAAGGERRSASEQPEAGPGLAARRSQLAAFPVMVDFGLTLRTAGEGTLGREALELDWKAAGTLGYMAPEQLRGDPLDARADLYALGCIGYELLAGRLPFEGTRREMALGHLRGEVVAPSKLVEGVPRELEDLLLRLLEKEPQRRLGHASDLERELGKLGGEPWPAEGLPRPRTVLYRPRLAGRQETLQTLRRELEQLRDGEGGLVLVGGESGVGKTRLVQEAAREAERAGLLVLSGESRAGLQGGQSGAGEQQEAGALEALRPALQRVADRCRERGVETTERLLGRRGKVLALYEPALAGLPGQQRHPEPAELPPEAARARLLADVVETLGALADERGLLLVLDDLQWADELTLGVLELLGRGGGALAVEHVLVLGTYRREEAGEALQKLLRQSGTRKLELGRLEEREVGEMVRDMLALQEGAESFARYLCRQSEGNPFFVAEYLRAAVGEGLLWRDERGRWQVAEAGEEQADEELYGRLELPQSVRELVGRRLELLGSSARQLVAVAAVLGKVVDGQVLTTAAGLGALEVLEGTLELLGQQVLEEAGRGALRFAHDKLREVAYARLGERTREELHRAAAEALEGLGPEKREEHLAELGHHWEWARVPDKALRWYLAAARQAKKRHAQAEAERLYRAYLSLVEEPSGEALLVRIELALDVLRIAGRVTEAVGVLESTVEGARQLGDRALEAEGLRGLGLVCIEQGRLERARGLFEQALTILRGAGDRQAEGIVLGSLAIVYHAEGRLEEACAHYEQALAIHRAVGNRQQEGMTSTNLAGVYLAQSRLGEAHALYEQALSILRAIGDQRREGIALGNLASVYGVQGRLEEARAFYEQALALCRAVGDRRFEGIVLGNLAAVFLEEDRLEEAGALCEQALAILRAIGDRRFEGSVLRIRASIDSDQGRLEEAGRYFEQALALQRAVGDRREEAHIRREEATLRRRCQEDMQRSEALLEQAELLLRELGDRLGLARCLCGRAHLALARGRVNRDLLSEAEHAAAALALTPQSPLAKAIARIQRAQAAFEAGEHERLFRGELIEDIPEGLRRWLVAAGHMERERARLPEG